MLPLLYASGHCICQDASWALAHMQWWAVVQGHGEWLAVIKIKHVCSRVCSPTC